MAFYDKDAPTEVVTDASPVGLGAILVQEKQGVKRAVAIASRSLSDVERRYSQTEKEALAVVWACERFHLYLSGLQSFELVTDCKALEAIYGPRSKPSARVERWVLRLMPFKYTVRHVPSGQNIADCLSRLTKMPASPRDGSTEEYVRMVAVNATPRAMTTREIERASAGDEEEERSGTTDQQARDQDAEQKKRVAETANKRAAESDIAEGDKVLLLKRKQNKLSAVYDPDPYSVISKKGGLSGH